MRIQDHALDDLRQGAVVVDLELLAHEIGWTEEKARGHLTLARLCLQRGRLREARRLAERGLAGFCETGDPSGRAQARIVLASCAEWEENPSGALDALGEALALFREANSEEGVAQGLTALGRLRASGGDRQRAAADLDEALAVARQLESPSLLLGAAAERARLPDGEPAEALRVLKERAGQLPVTARMEARFRLWQATREPNHLVEARRLLMHLRERTPPEHRRSMLENVPLHRDIVRAWAEHGAQVAQEGGG